MLDASDLISLADEAYFRVGFFIARPWAGGLFFVGYIIILIDNPAFDHFLV